MPARCSFVNRQRKWHSLGFRANGHLEGLNRHPSRRQSTTGKGAEMSQESLIATLVAEAQVEKAVFHWYTGTSSVLRDIISYGYFVSATPAVEYHEEHRRAVKETPMDRLLLETDCPVIYRRGTDSEYESRPAHTSRVLKGVSTVRDTDEAEISSITTGNAIRLFGLQNC